jgi:hypothetical protein
MADAVNAIPMDAAFMVPSVAGKIGQSVTLIRFVAPRK